MVRTGVGRLVIQIEGLWFPDDIGDRWRHAMKHVQSVEWAIARRKQRRVAVQAGGNVGLWPRRLAESFARVITFEPDEVSRACLRANVPESVDVWGMALGETPKWCGLSHKGLGSHRIMPGHDVPMTTVDSMKLLELDYLQLDIEGYEWHALQGAAETLERCKPLVQVELRGFSEKYGKSNDDVRAFLNGFGYHQVSAQSGSDFVFEAT